MSGFQQQVVQQPVSINWHVQDRTNDGILKVYLFQKNPQSRSIVTWKNALVEKLNQYNRANHANRGLFTPNADGSTTSHYQDQNYTLGPVSSKANYAHFNTLHTNYATVGDVCGDEMNPRYIDISIDKNYICMYVTDSSTGEERLHSVVMFDFKSTKVIYIDIFCTSTIPGYVNFKGGYRLMSLLYGICRHLSLHIELHSLDAAMKFYRDWGYREIPDTTSSLPKFTSTCNPRNTKSFKEVANLVIVAKRFISDLPAVDDNDKKLVYTKAETTINSVFSDINNLDRENSGSKAEATINSVFKAEVQGNVVVKVGEFVFNNIDGKNRGYWKVSNKVFDNTGKVISYDLYREDEDGNMKFLICVPAEYAETMNKHRKRLMDNKVRDATDFATKLLMKRNKKPSNKNPSNKTPSVLSDDSEEILGGSRKQPRKTKKRKTKRNSKKNKKNI